MQLQHAPQAHWAVLNLHADMHTNCGGITDLSTEDGDDKKVLSWQVLAITVRKAWLSMPPSNESDALIKLQSLQSAQEYAGTGALFSRSSMLAGVHLL